MTLAFGWREVTTNSSRSRLKSHSYRESQAGVLIVIDSMLLDQPSLLATTSALPSLSRGERLCYFKTVNPPPAIPAAPPLRYEQSSIRTSELAVVPTAPPARLEASFIKGMITRNYQYNDLNLDGFGNPLDTPYLT